MSHTPYLPPFRSSARRIFLVFPPSNFAPQFFFTLPPPFPSSPSSSPQQWGNRSVNRFTSTILLHQLTICISQFCDVFNCSPSYWLPVWQCVSFYWVRSLSFSSNKKNRNGIFASFFYLGGGVWLFVFCFVFFFALFMFCVCVFVH